MCDFPLALQFFSSSTHMRAMTHSLTHPSSNMNTTHHPNNMVPCYTSAKSSFSTLAQGFCILSGQYQITAKHVMRLSWHSLQCPSLIVCMPAKHMGWEMEEMGLCRILHSFCLCFSLDSVVSYLLAYRDLEN